MPRVNHVKVARKDYPEAGIRKGDSYYHWSFRYGGKHKSKNYPRPSQLTQSEFLVRVYEVNEKIEHLVWEDELEEVIEWTRDELQEIYDDTEEKLGNMPEQLQEAETGQLLTERMDAVEGMISELESVDLDVPEEPMKSNYTNSDEYEDDYDSWVTEADNAKDRIMEEIHCIQYSGS